MDESFQNHQTTTSEFIINNDKGLHTRPCTEIVRLAIQYNSEISLSCKKNVGDAKSVFSLLTLSAEKGACIHIEATGTDSQEAVKAIVELAKDDFYLEF